MAEDDSRKCAEGKPEPRRHSIHVERQTEEQATSARDTQERWEFRDSHHPQKQLQSELGSELEDVGFVRAERVPQNAMEESGLGGRREA